MFRRQCLDGEPPRQGGLVAADSMRYGWASRSRLQPIVKSARMIKRHSDNILTYFRHPITNAKSEAFNSRIQWLKSAVRGFRSFANYRIRILFHCGRLDMKSDGCH